MRSIRMSVVALILAVSLSACGGETPSAPSTNTQGPAATSAAATPTTEAGDATAEPTPASEATARPTLDAGGPTATGSSGWATVINVTVTGGPHAGEYEATSSEPTCSVGLAGEGAWGNQYSDADKKEGLSSLQLIVPDAEEAAQPTENFNVTFTFGELFATGSTDYTIEGREDMTAKGSGTVSIDDQGQRGTVHISAEPEDGVSIDATIQCNQVLRFTGGGDSTPATGDNGTPGPTTATINLTVEGGDAPGTYEATTTEDTCYYGGTGSMTEGLEDTGDAWSVEYLNENASEGLTQLDLVVPSGREAEAGTNKFFLSINDQTYYIENLEGSASYDPGKVTMVEGATTNTFNIDAKSDSGATVKGAIVCMRVVR